MYLQTMKEEQTLAKIRSFKELLFEQYEDEIFDRLSSFLEDAPENAELINCHDLDSVEPYSIAIKFVQIENLPGDEIRLDIVVETELLCTTQSRRYGSEDNIEHQWFTLDCAVEIADRLRNFAIHDISVYTGKRKSDNPLSDSLVPVFWKDELDDRADEFLKHYYPEALNSPMPIDTDTVAERLGVEIESAHLSRDCSIFGMMIFADTNVRVITEDGFVERPVSAGTLFYDPNVYFMRTLGSVRNTIIHECVHWTYHRKAMALERLFNQDVTDIRCHVQEVSQKQLKGNQRNPLDWMEWHANALAPRILMPKNMFREKAEETLRHYMEQHQTNHVSDVIEETIQDVARFFQVSRLSAKLRFIDIGYEEARGAYDYQNDSYIPCYAFRKGSIRGNQSFTLSALDFAAIYAGDIFQNGKLHQLFEQGILKYVDYSVCINDPKYIEQHANGWLSLTNYARKHMDECCLKFNLTYRSFASFGQTSKTYLFRKQVEALIPEISYSATENGEILDRAERLTRQSVQVKEVHALLMRLPGSFSKSLKMLMKVYGVTNEVLAKRAQCDARTIQRYRNNPESFEKDTVIDICVALKLPLALAEDLLNKAACPLGHSERDLTIKLLLSNGNYADIVDFHTQCTNILSTIP